VYTYLYDAMVAWYNAQRYSAGPYVHGYAVTTLTSMALVNMGSILALSAHWNAAWAVHLVGAMDPLLITLVGTGLLVAHILFSRWRRRRARPSESESDARSPSRWIALFYMVVSVAAFMYTSRLLPLAHAAGRPLLGH